MTAPIRTPEDLFAQQPDELYRLRLSTKEVTQVLIAELTPERPEGTDRTPALVWVDRDAEALVIPDKLRVALTPGLVIVEIALSTDQTKRAPLIVAYGIGVNAKSAELFATVEQVPRGNPILVARWGAVTQEIVWNALLRGAQRRWSEKFPKNKFTISGLYADKDELNVLFSRPVQAREIREYFSIPVSERQMFEPKPIDMTKWKPPRRDKPDKPDKPSTPDKPDKPRKPDRPDRPGKTPQNSTGRDKGGPEKPRKPQG